MAQEGLIATAPAPANELITAVAALVMPGEPSSPSTPATAGLGGGGTIICGRSTDAKDGGDYRFRWDWKMDPKPFTNPNGTSGWAKILDTTNPTVMPLSSRRVHLCKFNPCKAVWAASKHGKLGAPIHLQVVPSQSEVSAVAEASGSQLISRSSSSHRRGTVS